MIDERVQSTAGVCLVGGGDVCPQILAKALKYAPFVIAADGGADAALKAGQVPKAVIGDLDSISDSAKARLANAKVLHVAEQDSTDFEKCLARIDAPYVIAVGFTGGRLDHTLAAMSVLARCVGPPCVLLGAEDAVFAAPAEIDLDFAPGTRVSLFPMAPVSGRSTGLRWAIDGIDFTPSGRIGTSNEATGHVRLDIDGRGLLVIVPLGSLSAVISALAG